MLTTTPSRSGTETSQDSKTGSPSDDSHKNEGFLKSAWHRLTNQHRKDESTDSRDKSSDAGKKSDKDNSSNGSTGSS